MSYTARISASAAAKAYHYHAIFGDVCATRFQKLARFLFTSSYLLSVIIALPSSRSWVSILLPLRAIPLAFGLFLLTCLRKNNLHVDFVGYKTLASQVMGQLLSKKSALTFALYLASSVVFFATVYQDLNGLSIRAIPRKHQYPLLNDQFVFYSFYSFFIALVYSIHHSVFDKDRLVFTYGTFHAHPKSALMGKLPTVVTNSVIWTVFSIFIAPVCYAFVRSYLYDVIFLIFGIIYSFNHHYPSYGVSIGLLFKLTIISFLLFFIWELVNTAFNAYLSIGCLHRGHPLSELSTDPLGTLLKGLKSDKLFIKMTAFQELAYISKIDDPEGRIAIYNRNNKREFIWGEILQECEKVIKANNMNINKALIQQIVSETPKPRTETRDQHIFGREYYSLESERREKDIFTKPTITTQDQVSLLDNNSINMIISHFKQTAQLAKQYYSMFITSGFGIPFRHSVRREAERLCPVPVTVGNAIIAISLIVTHAYSEDKKGTVSSTITDVMEILEKSVSSCGQFVQNPPLGLVDKEEENLILMLHDLSMNAFVEVTVKYSDVLKDVVLSPDVIRLVNWTLETASRDDYN